MPLTLRPLTADTVDAILDLDVAPDQRAFVASNARTIAQAHFWPDVTRCLGAWDGEVPVGFVALSFEPHEPIFVWRMMVGAQHQRKGYGRAMMALVDDEVRRIRPEATELRVCHVVGEGDPGPFYEALGFRYTGELSDGERVMARPR